MKEKRLKTRVIVRIPNHHRVRIGRRVDRTTVVKTNAELFALGKISYKEYKARVAAHESGETRPSHKLSLVKEIG